MNYCEDFPGMLHTRVRELMIVATENEDNLLKEVLHRHLGRPITLDDFNDCEMKFREGRPSEYMFAHKGIDLGVVDRKTELSNNSQPYFSPDHYHVSYVISFQPVTSPSASL